MRFPALLAPVCAAALLITAQLVAAEGRLIDPPDEREFVLDFADIINKDDTAKISETGKKLFADTGVRMVVITIKSMNGYAGGDDSQTFARKLLDRWIEKQSAKLWSKAVLLIRAKEDKKVRTQLGAAWKRTQDENLAEIVKTVLTPLFKAGNESKGLMVTAKSFDKLLRKNIKEAAEEEEQAKAADGK